MDTLQSCGSGDSKGDVSRQEQHFVVEDPIEDNISNVAVGAGSPTMTSYSVMPLESVPDDTNGPQLEDARRPHTDIWGDNLGETTRKLPLSLKALKEFGESVMDGCIPLRTDTLDITGLAGVHHNDHSSVSTRPILATSMDRSAVGEHNFDELNSAVAPNGSGVQDILQERSFTLAEPTSVLSTDAQHGSVATARESSVALNERNIEQLQAYIHSGRPFPQDLSTLPFVSRVPTVSRQDRRDTDSSMVVEPSATANSVCHSFLYASPCDAESENYASAQSEPTEDQVSLCTARSNCCTSAKVPHVVGTDILNTDNLSQLRKQLASGETPLRPELLSSNRELGGLLPTSLGRPECTPSMVVEGADRYSSHGVGAANRNSSSFLNAQSPTFSSAFEDLGAYKGTCSSSGGAIVDGVQSADNFSQRCGSSSTSASNGLFVAHKDPEMRWPLEQAACEKALCSGEKPTNKCAKATVPSVGAKEPLLPSSEFPRDTESIEGKLFLLKSELDLLGRYVDNRMKALQNRVSEQLAAVVQGVESRLETMRREVHDTVSLSPESRIPVPSTEAGLSDKVPIVVQYASSDDDVHEYFIPLSCKATVGACKEEVIRRLKRSGVADSTLSVSNTVLLLDQYRLLEGDILGADLDIRTDEGTPAMPHRLTLCRVSDSS